MRTVTAGVVKGVALLRRAVARRRHDDAGEIQGWVFVTLMTAGLVFAIWQVAQGRLTTLFEQAISSVTGG
ncbi:MAG: hypothetical protein ACKVZ6_07795 [Kineosporiaceae bacterium]